MAGFADHVARQWREPDAGIWEIRGDAQHHVHSKLMAWLAPRPGLAHRRHAPARASAGAIIGETSAPPSSTKCAARGFQRGAGQLHAHLRVRRPRRRAARPAARRHRTTGLAACQRDTIDAIARELAAGGPLLYRYPPGRDGLAGAEGAFLPCAFWLVQALAKTGRRRRGHGSARGARAAREPARPLRRGDGPDHARSPRQLPAGAHPRGARAGRPRCSATPERAVATPSAAPARDGCEWPCGRAARRARTRGRSRSG